MFLDLGLLSHFSVDYPTFCRWVLTVRRNYRSAESGVPYHNWHHAFNVAQMMFAMIRSPGAKWDQQFSKVFSLGGKRVDFFKAFCSWFVGKEVGSDLETVQ